MADGNLSTFPGLPSTYAGAASDSADAAAASEAAAAASLADTTTLAGTVSSLAFTTDDYPGVEGPNVRLVDANGNDVWDAYTEQARVDALEDNYLSESTDDWPGVAASLKYLDPSGRDFTPSSASSGGSTVLAAALASTRNASTYSAALTSLGTWLMVLPCYLSQSNGIEGGTDRAGMLLNSTAPAPSNVFMPSIGMWPYQQTWTTAIAAIDQYYDSSHNSLGAVSTGATQAIVGHVEFIYEVYSLLSSELSITSNILGWIEGAGGQEIYNLTPGTTTFEAAMNDHQRSRDWAVTASYTGSFCPLVKVVQGEADSESLGKSETKSWWMYAWRENATKVRQLYGQTQSPIILMEQLAFSETSAFDPSAVHQAQLELALEHPDKFALGSPGYDCEKYDGTHYNEPNHYIRNKRLAGTAFDALFRGGALPLCIVDAYFTSTTNLQIVIPVRNPPIVIEPWSTVTLTIASPGKVNWTSHGLSNGYPVNIATTGALPTGLTAGKVYYVRNAGANDFELSATPSGTSINFTGSQSGTHTATAGFVSQSGLDFGASVSNGQGGKGLFFDDGSGASPYITQVAIATLTSGMTTVTLDGSLPVSTIGAKTPKGRAVLNITLSAAPTGTGRWKLQAGARATGSGGGPNNGGRTLIHDSYSRKSKYDRYGVDLTVGGTYPSDGWSLWNWLAFQTYIVKP